MMVYDREIRWMVRVALGLFALNGGLGMASAFRHDWLTMIAYLIWAVNIWGWLRSMKVQQRTRDLMRLHEAAFLKVLEIAAGDAEDA